ncbi:L,D-transpeptidase [Williamsia sp. MIQD14]|uniref:L,D-transpeptidase n=1 Tax=Williamsia sp. MIQD14 TaxID=3425703 RepID=UPI003DA16AD8
MPLRLRNDLTGWSRDYWWALIVVPLALIVSGVLVAGSFTSTSSSPRAVTAAVTSAAPSRSGVAPTTSSIAAADTAACRGVDGGKSVVVSISEQRMRMCDASSLVEASYVTTGIDNRTDRTPTGTWKIVAEETDRYLVGSDYRVFVHYWMPFFGDFGFHDSPWQNFDYGSPKYRTNGSRGCVHVPGATMASLYRWAGVGTTVTIRA